MANPDHIAELMKGVASWNAWREENPDVDLDLSGADLNHTDLSGADLRGVNLSGANLRGVSLSGANLSVADLSVADLSGPRFREAHLSGPHFRGANLSRADLSNASLDEADLFEANLSEANLASANLSEANLAWANLAKANLTAANLMRANLPHTHLRGADLRGANLSEAYLSETDASKAHFKGANLFAADFRGANLSETDLSRTDAWRVDFTSADLRKADLSEVALLWADLSHANLAEANLRKASLQVATLVNADLTNADLTDCQVYGVSAWGLKLEGAKQQNLVITPSPSKSHIFKDPISIAENEPEITVDNIEVAQFIYLMLHNQKIRNVIDTITAKAVLILGRFTDERKAVLDALREELRKRDYLPMLFDFAVPATRDITETVSLLARMARFIIADLTDPSSIPKELEAIVPHLAVPVQPLLEGSSRSYAMFKDYWKYDWVLPPYQYDGLEPLLANLAERVIGPAEAKVKALEERRRMIEAELTKASS
jgi:uncharacterized protein YjbI with pentapeptide repeats